MPPSFLATVRSLPRTPRLFLLFTAINVVSWQCIAGHPLVLFGRAVGMPPSWVGFLLSFMPLSMLLVSVSVPLVEWLGPRRLLVWSWLARNLLAATVLLMPWAMERWGAEAGWRLLLFAVLAFSVVRAFGVGAWYPWLHEIVPKPFSGAYFSLETIVTQTVNVLLAVGVALFFGVAGDISRFYWLNGAGVLAGMASVLFASGMPGGEMRPRLAAERAPSMARALADRRYLFFLVLAAAGASAIAWLNSAAVMYLRDILGYSDTRIMGLLAVGSVGIAFTVRSWGRHAERSGSVTAMIQLLTGYALVSVLWCGLTPGARWNAVASVALAFFTAVFNAAFSMVASRGMMNRVQADNRVGYTTIWVMAMALAGSIPAICAGQIISHWRLAGFHACFLIAGGTAVVTAGLFFRLAAREGAPRRVEVRSQVQPRQPLRTLGRVFWITAGLSGQAESEAGQM